MVDHGLWCRDASYDCGYENGDMDMAVRAMA